MSTGRDDTDGEPDRRVPDRSVVTGSIALCHALIDAGLVDEFRLFTYPHVQGRGRRLFEDRTTVPELRLVEVRAFRGGIVLSRYRADAA